jgi:hypothetical protein
MSKMDLRSLKILEKPYKYSLKKKARKKRKGGEKIYIYIHKKLKCKGLET